MYLTNLTKPCHLSDVCPQSILVEVNKINCGIIQYNGLSHNINDIVVYINNHAFISTSSLFCSTSPSFSSSSLISQFELSIQWDRKDGNGHTSTACTYTVSFTTVLQNIIIIYILKI